MRSRRTFRGTMVCPKLLEHVKEDIAKHSELMKSMLKAREFRAAMAKK